MNQELIKTFLESNADPIFESNSMANLYTELSVISCLFKSDRGFFTKLKYSSEVPISSDIFHYRKIRQLYKKYELLYETQGQMEKPLPVTATLFYSKLDSEEKQVFPFNTLSAIEDFPARIDQIEAYMQELDKLYEKRQYHDLSDGIRRQIAQGMTPEEIKTYTYSQLQGIGQKQFNTISKASDTFLELIHFDHANKSYEYVDPYRCIATGYAEQDEYFNGGWRGAEFIIVGARPAIGKTSYLLGIAFNIASRGEPVYINSMEMTRKQVIRRLIPMACNLPSQMIRAGAAPYDEMIKAYEIINNLPLYIDDQAYIDVATARVRVLSLQDELGKQIGLYAADYLQLFKGSKTVRYSNKTEEIEVMTMDLKNLSKELEAPVVALSQLSRDLEKRENKRPVLSDLRSSGGAEQAADAVIFLYRDEYYNPNTADKKIAEIIIAKQREGPVGTIKMFFDATMTSFKNQIRT